jgi:hypothetical protein
MRTIILGAVGAMMLTAAYQVEALQYTVPDQPPIRLTRQDSSEILALIENQLSALEHGDFRDAYSKYTAAPFQEVTSYEDFVYFVQSYPAIGKNKSAIFGAVQIFDNVASIEGTLGSLDGKSTRVVFFLIKEKNSWKIIGIEPVQEKKK